MRIGMSVELVNTGQFSFRIGWLEPDADTSVMDPRSDAIRMAEMRTMPVLKW